MNRTRFSTSIKAPKEKVWNVLWGDSTYREWTSVFSEGSHVVTDWKEGGKVLFLDGKGQGMFSVIDKNIPGEYMAFKHMGVLKDGKELPLDDETKKWSGSMETYTLKESGGTTELTVELDMNDEFKDYFEKTFPKALDKVKALSEGMSTNS